jgi:hypothetical protein
MRIKLWTKNKMKAGITIRYPATVDLLPSYTGATTTLSKTEYAAITCLATDVIITNDAEVQADSQLTLYVNYTKGTEDGIKIRFYNAHVKSPATFPSTDWYQETIESDTLGVATLYPFEIDLAATSGCISYDLPVSATVAFLVSVQAYGAGATTGTLTMTLAARTN